MGNVFNAYNAISPRNTVEGRSFWKNEPEATNSSSTQDPNLISVENQRVTECGTQGFCNYLLENGYTLDDILAFNYANAASYEDSANSLIEYLRLLKLPAPTMYDKPKINVIVHSMGGLVTRSMFELHTNEEVPVKLNNLVTWATPHFGTYIDAAGAGAWVGLPAFEMLDQSTEIWDRLNETAQKEFLDRSLGSKYHFIMGKAIEPTLWSKLKGADIPNDLFSVTATTNYDDLVENRLKVIRLDYSYSLDSSDGVVDTNSGLGSSSPNIVKIELEA